MLRPWPARESMKSNKHRLLLSHCLVRASRPWFCCKLMDEKEKISVRVSEFIFLASCRNSETPTLLFLGFTLDPIILYLSSHLCLLSSIGTTVDFAFDFVGNSV